MALSIYLFLRFSGHSGRMQRAYDLHNNFFDRQHRTLSDLTATVAAYVVNPTGWVDRIEDSIRHAFSS